MISNSWINRARVDADLQVEAEKPPLTCWVCSPNDAAHEPRRNLLYAAERVVELGQGQYQGKQGLVVLTSERLFFLEKSLGSESIDEFSLAAINSLSVRKKLGGERLVVHVSGSGSEIKNMWHGHADALVHAFHTLRQAPDPASEVASTSSSVDVLSALE